MTIDIVSVKQAPLRDSYIVTGQVGVRQKEVEVSGYVFERKLLELGGNGRETYELRDLVPLIAQVATPALVAAFKL